MKKTYPTWCHECNSEYGTTNKSTVKIAFCRKCRLERENDLVEIITSDGIKIFKNDQQSESEALIKKYEHSVRLDLHGVLDLLEVDYDLNKDPKDVCVVSYVGKLTITRIGAKRIYKGE